MSSAISRFFLQEDLNFLVTNRIPRRYASLAMARFSHIQSRPLTRLSLWVWSQFAPDLHLDEAKTTEFNSLHECFTRELKPGARPIDPDADVAVSPCDAIVGAFGRIQGGQLIQAKGFPYTLEDLLHDPTLVARYRDGWFVTLRLRSDMYHRFHAPCAGALRKVTYIAGDTWNVNPVALRRVERLFCKNERAVLDLDLGRADAGLTLVPVAAILVAGIKLHCLEPVLNLEYRGANELSCRADYEKGQEMGYFQSGSTIIVFASGALEPCDDLVEGRAIRVGQPLLRGLARPRLRGEPVHD